MTAKPATGKITGKNWERWTDHQLRLRDALSWTFASAPLAPGVDAYGRMLLLDTIGCMLAGRVAPEVIALEEQFNNLESGPFSFPQGRRLTSSAICTIGAMAATWDEACEGHALAHGRPGAALIAALLPLALTRDNKEVINVQADGGCTKKPRIFDADSSYSFDATETEPPNTNSFFGPGGYAIWASDNNALKVRGCIIISSGLGSDIAKCIDMKFD